MAVFRVEKNERLYHHVQPSPAEYAPYAISRSPNKPQDFENNKVKIPMFVLKQCHE